MRDALKVYVPILAILVAVGLFAWHLMAPPPPHDLAIAAGPADGAYSAFAERYKKLLAASGLTLEVIHTSGAIENRQLMTEGKADVAFMQGGTISVDPDTGQPPEGIEALASVYYEPLWVFVRSVSPLDRLSQLAGMRIAIGPEDSGTHALAVSLLGISGVANGKSRTKLLPLGSADAAKALIDGAIDAALFVNGKISPAMQSLVEAPNVRVMNFAQADAYHHRLPFLSAVTLPRGALDLARNIPSRPLALVAPAAQLVARDDINPALVDALLEAAQRTHRQGGLFERPDEFPSRNLVELPLNAEADRYFRSGPSLVRRYLPFWAASLVERALILVLPLLTVAIPLIRYAPSIYAWQVSRRILRWYRRLRTIEAEARGGASQERRAELVTELDDIQGHVAKIKVPSNYAQSLYDLRFHIDFIKQLIGTGLH
jgi:TRAP transporter TAXI family solute receptor